MSEEVKEGVSVKFSLSQVSVNVSPISMERASSPRKVRVFITGIEEEESEDVSDVSSLEEARGPMLQLDASKTPTSRKGIHCFSLKFSFKKKTPHHGVSSVLEYPHLEFSRLLENRYPFFDVSKDKENNLHAKKQCKRALIFRILI